MANQVQQLRRRFVLTGAGLAFGAVIVLAWITSTRAESVLQRQANERGVDLAVRVAALVTQYLHERRREAEVLAVSPAVVRAARQASQDAVARGLAALDIPTLENTFAQRRAMGGGDPELEQFFRNYPQRSNVVEVSFTESHGFNVITSARGPDFVQADEDWWRGAMQNGVFEGDPQYDSVRTAVSLEYDVAIQAPGESRRLGVLRTVFDLDRLAALLGAGELGGRSYLQVVDSGGRIVVSPDPASLLQPITSLLIQRGERPRAAVVGDELIITAPANQGRWWVLLRQPTATAYALARTEGRGIWVGSALLFFGMVGMLVWLSRWLNNRITEPVKAAGRIASRVAGGDLSVTVASTHVAAGEVGELLTSVQSMVLALRRLVGAIRTAADEAAAMAAQISASTEQMSASTQEMASTTQDLTRRAGEQAQTVRAAADDASRILQIATTLAQGSDEAARRNAALAERARGHKASLDQSTVQLTRLVEDVNRGAQEADALAQASADIQRFVSQAKSVATQTNMLALNAAIEAARAGPQGRGFAVVADEVRKLASLAAASAGETADIVRGVLAKVQTTRDRLVRLAVGGASVRDSAQQAAEGLATVAGEAAANDAWSREIAVSASEVRTLVGEIAARLATVADSTDGLLAASQELAASSEEQSASTEEIASSANQLAQAADNLSATVKSFRLLADDQPQAQAAD